MQGVRFIASGRVDGQEAAPEQQNELEVLQKGACKREGGLRGSQELDSDGKFSAHRSEQSSGRAADKTTGQAQLFTKPVLAHEESIVRDRRQSTVRTFFNQQNTAHDALCQKHLNTSPAHS